MFSFFPSLFSFKLLGEDNSHIEKFVLVKILRRLFTGYSWILEQSETIEWWNLYCMNALEGVRGSSRVEEQIENSMNEYCMNVFLFLKDKIPN